MEQAYFQALPFSGGVRARPTLLRKSIPTHPHFPVPSAISFPITHGKPTKTRECPTLKAFIIFTGHFTWECAIRRQGCHRFSLESHRTACPTASSCLQGQSSSEGGSKICQLVKHNRDISMLSLSQPWVQGHVEFCGCFALLWCPMSGALISTQKVTVSILWFRVLFISSATLVCWLHSPSPL